MNEKQREKYKIGIVGIGFVGGAVRNWFETSSSKKCELFFYDKHKSIGSLEEVNQADVVFVCVPTPYENKYDDSAVTETLRNLTENKIVVLKSTILPGSTERYQKEFPQHALLFNPEFLVARTANEDFLHPGRQIVGYTDKSRNYAEDIMSLLPFAPLAKIVPATEAEMVKYFGNTFLATRVVFANQIYDVCEKLGIDYETVKELAGADPRIGTSHFTVFHDGKRGYSGGCLPKDVSAFIDFAASKGVAPDLLRTVYTINENLLKKDKYGEPKG